MVRRARPCKHVRRIRTKRGIKRVVVNPKIKKRVIKRRRNYGAIPIQDANQLTLYHGTDTDSLEGIKQEGLLSSNIVGKKTYENINRGFDKKLNVVSLTSKPTYASGYAVMAASRRKSEPVILKVKVPREQIDVGFFGKDSYYPGQDEFYTKEGYIPKRVTVLAKGKKELDDLWLKRSKRDWKK